MKKAKAAAPKVTPPPKAAVTSKTPAKTPKTAPRSRKTETGTEAPRSLGTPVPDATGREGGRTVALSAQTGSNDPNAGSAAPKQKRTRRDALETSLQGKPSQEAMELMALAEYYQGAPIGGSDPWEVFLRAIASLPSRKRAFEESGLDRWTVHTRLRDDRAFAARFLEAWEMGIDALEDEAVRRAVLGWYEPVFSQGMYCGEILKYSDSLLTTLLRANRRKYRGEDAASQRGLSEEGKSQLQSVFSRALADLS